MSNLNSFRHLTSTPEQQDEELDFHQEKENQILLPCAEEAVDNKVPLEAAVGESSHENERNSQNEDAENTAASDMEVQNEENAESSQISQELSPGLSLLQAAAASSPPPHSYRHSRAYRHFKNPPQPHMCIRTTTETGEELFINVLSWTRIVIPQEATDPIPLYGGMRVPPGSPRSPPIVFAVMANPEVLKDSGRHSKDPEERRAMVELMCDFVEAMNPGVKLVRNAIILKDRDISGELKDVWNAVQAQRDREREEQMMQQRQHQQQHYHNLATNAATNGGSVIGLNNGTNIGITPQAINQQQQIFAKNSGVVGLSLLGEGTPPRSRKLVMSESQMNEECCGNLVEVDVSNTMSLAKLAEQLDNKIAASGDDNHTISQEILSEGNQIIKNSLSNGNECKDALDSSKCSHTKNDVNNQLNANNCATTALENSNKSNGTNGALSNANIVESTATSSTNSIVTHTSTTVANVAVNTNSTTSPPANTTSTQNVNPTPPPPVTKKEKLGGFLPNGCIFPRFTKNNKHKDKDKEGKTKDKEKNVLLSALKKSKDKKAQASTASASQDDKHQQQQKELNFTNTSTNTIKSITANTTTTTSSSSTINNHNNASRNCIQQIECQVQKLDLNDSGKSSPDTSTNPPQVESNTSLNSSTTTNSSNNSNKTGVGVH